MFTAWPADKCQSAAQRNLENSASVSGRRFRRLFVLARLGAYGLARRCRADHGRRRPAGLAAASVRSGSGLYWARQVISVWDVVATIFAVTPPTSGHSFAH